MRVVLLTSTLSPAAGGLSSSIPALAVQLQRLDGVDVHVVGTIDPLAPDAAHGWGRQVHAHRVRGPAAVQYAPRLLRTLAGIRPDVIDVQGLWTYPSLAGLLYQQMRSTTCVVTPRGMLDPWALQRSRIKKQFASLLFQDCQLRNAACLRATASMEADHFRGIGLRNPIAIVPNGVETPPHSPTKRGPNGTRRLLFLSRLHPKKGLEFLLRAWAELAPERPNWELAIAGPDEVGHEAEMKRLCATLGLARIVWLGPVHGQSKTEIYRSSELFVLPTHAENFGLVIAEALAHGLPVVTTRNAPWSDLDAHRCGWWIPLSAAQLLSTLKVATLAPPEELCAMGARGRAWMQQDFSLESVASRMLAVYEWVSGRGGRPGFVATV